VASLKKCKPILRRAWEVLFGLFAMLFPFVVMAILLIFILFQIDSK